MNLLKKTITVFIVAVLLMLSVSTGFAETIYYYNGYFYSYINNDTVALKGWEKDQTSLAIPDTLNNRAVITIPDRAFYADSDITGIDFSNAHHLQNIGIYAFAYCFSLSGKLVFPENVTFIGDSAFANCVSVSEVVIQSDLENISLQSFDHCESLNRVELNGAVQKIDDYAFANCPELEYVFIPSSVTEISPTAFDNDTNLEIYGFADSYAQTYAQEHNIPFVEMVRFMLGDVDGKDGVNINDVTAIQSHLAELQTLENVFLLAADANQDDIVDISDATAIQMILAEYDLPYPIGQYVTKEVVTQENN